ncbi:MAG: DUF3494 domain-containing protein [Opitutales bacterium]|nr:DUF3494 domain-containing protein [Opitutales bacterium]
MESKPSILFSIASIFVFALTVSGSQAPVNLGMAGEYVILSKTGVTTTGTTKITRNVGVSPIDATGITGFELTLDASNVFATSPLVTGRLFASDYAPPTPSNLTTSIADMMTAYTDAAGRSLPDTTELGAGNISGMTLTPGLDLVRNHRAFLLRCQQRARLGPSRRTRLALR